MTILSNMLVESALFGEPAQYCDYVSEMIIEWRSYQVVYYVGSKSEFPPTITIEKYWSLKKAHQKYHEAIGRAIRGGWSLKSLRNKTGESIFSFEYKKGTKGNWK